MQKHLESHIKPLMDQFPALGTILDEAGIGCTRCSLGACRIQDILEIHDLNTEHTLFLLKKMGEIIYQGTPFQLPSIERKATAPEASFCPPIQRMVAEHTYILRVIALLPGLTTALREDFEAARAHADVTLDFIRTYADRYHHAKEEDILFRFLEQGSDILKAMLQDHEEGRTHVRAVALALESRNFAKMEHHLLAYGELLKGHILREDTILYPWINRSLSDRQVGQLFAQCAEVERAFGPIPALQEQIVVELEATLG